MARSRAGRGGGGVGAGGWGGPPAAARYNTTLVLPPSSHTSSVIDVSIVDKLDKTTNIAINHSELTSYT